MLKYEKTKKEKYSQFKETKGIKLKSSYLLIFIHSFMFRLFFIFIAAAFFFSEEKFDDIHRTPLFVESSTGDTISVF